MAKLTITIDVDKLISTDESIDASVVYLLRKLANKIEENGYHVARTLYDINGNPVGKSQF